MRHLRALLVSATALALTFGLQFPDPKLRGESSPLPNDGVLVLAANDEQSAQPQVQTESAKMGQHSGTQTGDKATVPERDTKKADQPPGAHPGNAN